MSWIAVLMATVVALLLAGFAVWLCGPLADVVQWLNGPEDADGVAPPQ